jgi:hypothetical protein
MGRVSNGWAQMIRHWMVIFDAFSSIIGIKSEFNGEWVRLMTTKIEIIVQGFRDVPASRGGG